MIDWSGASDVRIFRLGLHYSRAFEVEWLTCLLILLVNISILCGLACTLAGSRGLESPVADPGSCAWTVPHSFSFFFFSFFSCSLLLYSKEKVVGSLVA